MSTTDTTNAIPSTDPPAASRRTRRARADHDNAVSLVQEAAILLWAGPAVLLQLALPGVGKGVARHSTTLIRPLDRLRTTLQFVYVVMIGTEEEKQAVIRMVNRAHGPVRGSGYTAFDPALQLWVAATLVVNTVRLRRFLFGEMSPSAAAQIYRQVQDFGNVLQVEPERWPADLPAFEEYWENMIDSELSADAEIVDYVHQLLKGGSGPLPVRMLMPLQRLVTRGLLDPRVREMFELPWTPRDQRRFDRFMKIFRAVYLRVPLRLRRLPSELYMRDLRRRLRAHRP